MPDRAPMTVTLGDGQINLNGVVLHNTGVTFARDGIETARIEAEPLFRLDNDAEFTATATVDNYDAFEAVMRHSATRTRTEPTAVTYNPYFTHEDLQRLIDQVTATPHTYAVSAQDIQLGVDLARHRDGLDARAYMFDNPWVTYNPSIYSIVTEDEEPELDEQNDKLDGFLGEFIKEAV